MVSRALFVLSVALILLIPPHPAQGGLTIEFLGERFVTRATTIPSLGGVAFDPVDRRLVSLEHRDVCGGQLMEVQTAGNGAAWDYVNEEFWYIDNDRDVYRLVGGNKDVIFTIPENFTVPGVGPATLDRPEGIATDMTHVYVVDAGPSGTRGELASNEWFKFDRSGNPVGSSASTDFLAELQPHFDAFGDCIVDGLTWIPPDAPYGNGLFLMAIEHSGIQVLDGDGMFVDRLLWQDQDIPLGAVPFGFAGITMDPQEGDLYLVENGGNLTIFERLEDDGPQIGVFGVAVRALHLPASDCGWSIHTPGSVGLEFSLTYRTEDGLLWTNDFSTGEIFTMDPRYPLPLSRGQSGIVNVWGMAYDDERDVIYLMKEPQWELYAMDPTTLQTSLLPTSGTYVREIAFNSIDKHIYGVGGTSGDSQLVRFDRDTGEATVVGPTVNVAGISFDPTTGNLIGRSQSNTPPVVLYEIEPTTGQAQILANVSIAGWEGLATIPIEPVATSARPTQVAGGGLHLRSFPNPAAATTLISFELPGAARVDVAIYDLAGRKVTDLHRGPLSSGLQELVWNGRDSAGHPAASGVYFLRASTAHTSASHKITLLR